MSRSGRPSCSRTSIAVTISPRKLMSPRTVDDVFGVLVVVFQLAGHRQDLCVHEVADGVKNVALYLGETFGLQETTHAPPLSGCKGC